MSTDQRSLEGRVALVTGAAAGIGRATALEMAVRGARVAAVDLNPDGIAEVAKEITAHGGRATSLAADLRKIETFTGLFDQVEADLGAPVDVLVNIAGVTRFIAIEETTLEDWDLITNTNARATFFMMQAAIPHMQRAGRGSIINCSSIAGKGFPNTSCAVYAASKAAVISMSRVASAKLGAHHIRVNCICPGPTQTEMVLSGMEGVAQRTGRTASEVLDDYVKVMPLGFMAVPEDIANAFCFLASDEARFVTGQAWNIDGGLVFD